MAGERPILMSDDDAERLRRILGRTFSGDGVVEVYQTDDAVTISFRGTNRGGGGGMPQVRDAKPCILVLDPDTSDQTGEPGTQCGYRYDGYDVGVDWSMTDAPTLFDSLGPELPREAVGWFDPSPDGMWGWARWDASAEQWILWYAPGERWHVPGSCNPCTPSP